MFFKCINVPPLHALKNRLLLLIEQRLRLILTHLIIGNIDNLKQILIDLQVVKIKVINPYSILYFIACTIPYHKLIAFQIDINELDFYLLVILAHYVDYLCDPVVEYFDLVLHIECTVLHIHQALNILICAFDENKIARVSVISSVICVILVDVVGEDEEAII